MGPPLATCVFRINKWNRIQVVYVHIYIVLVQNAIVERLDGSEIVLQMIIVGC